MHHSRRWSDPGDEALEAKLHQRFKHYRLKGEWFTLNPEIESFIKKTKCQRQQRSISYQQSLAGNMGRSEAELQLRHPGYFDLDPEQVLYHPIEFRMEFGEFIEQTHTYPPHWNLHNGFGDWDTIRAFLCVNYDRFSLWEKGVAVPPEPKPVPLATPENCLNNSVESVKYLPRVWEGEAEKCRDPVFVLFPERPMHVWSSQDSCAGFGPSVDTVEMDIDYCLGKSRSARPSECKSIMVQLRASYDCQSELVEKVTQVIHKTRIAALESNRRELIRWTHNYLPKR